MKKQEKRIPIGIEIDKLTRSIEKVRTGEILQTRVVRVLEADSSKLESTDWLFDWSIEFLQDREVYTLTAVKFPDTIQGLISLSEEPDHVFVHLVENASHNRGREKIYQGVAGNLFAFACKRSFELGLRGNVAFEAKTVLIEHYEALLGAKRFGRQRMLIETSEAKELVHRYFGI